MARISARNYMILLLAVFSVSWASIFIKFSSAPSLVIAFYRMGIATLVLLPIVLSGNLRALFDFLQTNYRIAVLSGIFLGLHFATWISSLAYTSVASSVVIVATQPIFAAVFSHFWLKEKINFKLLLGIIIAFVGVLIISQGDLKLSKEYLKGDILSLLGAGMAALYLTIGRKVRQTQNLLPYIFTVYFISTLVLLIFCLVSQKNLYPYPALDFLWFFLLALVPTLIGHSLYNWILKYVKAYIVGVSILGEPVGATIWAYLLLKEIPNTSIYWGGLFILAGVWWTLISERNLD